MKILMLVLFILFLSLPVLSQSEEELKGRKAPNFKLEDLDGKFFELKNALGKGPILLSFWATWCKPCVEELAEFEKIYKDFKDKGFRLYAISVDNERSVSKVKPFVRSKGYSFHVLLDTNSEVMRKYYAPAVPYSVIIDKDGNIVYTHLGYMKGDELKVREILNKMYQ